MTETDIVELFGFTPRQGNYYYNGCRYINLLQKEGGVITLTTRGKSLLHMTYKQRQLKIVSYVLEHQLFNHLFNVYLYSGNIPDKPYIQKVMKELNVCQESLIGRRSSSAASWLNWIISLIN